MSHYEYSMKVESLSFLCVWPRLRITEYTAAAMIRMGTHCINPMSG